MRPPCVMRARVGLARPSCGRRCLPLDFTSGVFAPDVNLPRWLRDVAEFFPVQHLPDGLHAAYAPFTSGSGFEWTDLGVLAL